MTLLEKGQGPPIVGVQVPKEFYWVLAEPTPLAGMKYPAASFPWSNLHAAGFAKVVSLHPGPYDPTPLTKVFSEHLEDLVSGGPPQDDMREREKISRAVKALVGALKSRQGVVVHCVGGRGRSGTVLGCCLRELGFGADEIIEYLDRLHKARSKPGWPESLWQSSVVHEWNPSA